MHIALYCRGWPADKFTNGVVTYVHNLRNELISTGHRVSVFANEIGETNKDSGIYPVAPTMKSRIVSKMARLVRRGSTDAFDWGEAIAAAMNQVHRTQPIDILEMEESFGWCADVQRRVPIPVVVKLHGPAFLTLVDPSPRTNMQHARIELEGDALRQMSAIISPSRCALVSTVSRYQLDPKIKKVIPNPIAMHLDSAPWMLDQCDRKTILFVGRFDSLKGGDTALLAFRQLLESDGSLKLIFVGPDRGLVKKDGSRVDFDEFANSLFQERQRRNISYLGALPPSRIAELRRKALITLVVSRWESQGYTALEAMIQGCPIVVTDTGGLSELVEHGVTGLVAQLDSIDDLCEKVIYLLNNPSKARQLGERARQFVIKRHSVQHVARETVEIYRRAISMAKAVSA